MTQEFSAILIEWQKRHGRRDLPWQISNDPYAIWVSEIMLQQTQVVTVIPYYERFLSAFPNLEALASASLDDVLSLWSGLGYYSRARNLHKAAKMLSNLGKFPDSPEALSGLPGIGRSTAAAIAAFAFSRRAAILDGNVKRVFARFFGIEGHPGEKGVENRMWEKAESLLPESEIGCYTQALMDLGAGLCSRRNPDCAKCPLNSGCIARLSGRVHELPQPAPKKALPLRETTFLVLAREGRLLFERRPGKGIWAELLCFPELAQGQDLSVFDPSNTECLPSFTHAFTHFRLKIEAVLIETGKHREGIWLSMEEALASPIPNPVRKILGRIRQPFP